LKISRTAQKEIRAMFSRIKYVIRLMALAHLLVVVSWSYGQEPTIDVSGSAETRAKPDEVVITAGIDSTGKTVVQASDENDKLVKNLLSFLKSSGIDDRSIRTNYITIRAEYPSHPGYYSQMPAKVQTTIAEPQLGPAEPIGFRASRSFDITLKDVSKFESIYKGILSMGVNRVDGVDFRSTELRKLRDQARQEAMKAAKEKAVAMAGELGAKIVGVKMIEEQPSLPSLGSPRSWLGYEAPNAAPMQVSLPSSSGDLMNPGNGGEISVRAQVRVVFLLGETKF
jgi:uncharacterized protein